MRKKDTMFERTETETVREGRKEAAVRFRLLYKTSILQSLQSSMRVSWKRQNVSEERETTMKAEGRCLNVIVVSSGSLGGKARSHERMAKK